MNGGRVGEVVLHVGGNAVASEGVLRHVHPLGDSPRLCLADGGACVPKVLPAAELEGILAGLIVAVPLEPAGGAAVSNDVEEPQDLAVEPTLVEMTQGRKACLILRLPDDCDGFLIVGGLYSVTAWRDNDREGHSVFTRPC